MSRHKDKDSSGRDEAKKLAGVEGSKPGPDTAAGRADGGKAPEQAPPERRIAPEEFDKVVRERDEYLDLARRARADYLNLQRRSEAQAASTRTEAQQRFALDMIAVLDDLERALEHVKKDQGGQQVIKGIMLVLENFLAALAGYGITPIEAHGAKFDHGLHHAIAEQPTDEAEPGTVVAVAQRGFLANGRLLRPAQVVVAARSAPPNEIEPLDENVGE